MKKKSMAKKPKAKIDKWSIVFDFGCPQIIGTVNGHSARPDLEDGTEVRTSKVLNIDFERMKAETLNTIYELGEMVVSYIVVGKSGKMR